MSVSKNSSFTHIQYLTYPKELGRKCISCGSPIVFLYPSGGHEYMDFQGKIKEVRKFYCCTNPDCKLHAKPLNPSPLNVLPFKQFSLGIWKWIAQEAKLYRQKPALICERIYDQFNVKISESTIRKYINEIDAFLSNQIDKRTIKILKAQGKIILALDGQKPDKNRAALWLFVDLISNRVLKIVILESADHSTIHALVEEILTFFEVELVGLVSDKQGSIVKMRDSFYSKIPHQYCHFHFLQNLWNHIEVKDGNLHKELSKAVNNLHILKVSKTSKISFEGIGKAPIREVFQEVEQSLRTLIKARTRKFEHLRGVEVYERLCRYVEEMDRVLAAEDPDRKIVKLMNKTADSLHQALKETENHYKACVELNETFQSVRKSLGKEPDSKKAEVKEPSVLKEEKLTVLDEFFEEIWEKVKGFGKIMEKSQLRTFLPQKDTPANIIKQEWVRLYYSYRRGLCAYYDFPILAKTNSPMETKFSQEKSIFISRVGREQIGSQIRIRGEHVLKQLYAGKQEIKEIIKAMGTDYDRVQIIKELNALARRTKEETKLWKNAIHETLGLKSVLAKGKKSPKNKSRNKKNNFVG